MNRIFFVVLLQLLIALGHSDDELDKRLTRQESRTFSSYTCDEKSHFTKISRIVTDYFTVECNAVYQGRNNYTVAATLTNGKDIPLQVVHSCFALRDVNGTEVYSNLGVIRDGQCVGAIVYIYGLSRVIKGGCESPIGAKVMEVPNGQALFTIRGICDSTCWGTVSTVYNPGKFNYVESGVKNTGYSGYDQDYFIDYKRIS